MFALPFCWSNLVTYLIIFLVFCTALWLAERPVCECRHPFDAKRDPRCPVHGRKWKAVK